MPPKRRRRFQGLYYHSSPPKVLPMNGQSSNQGRKRRDVDEFAVKLSTIRIWMHEKDIGKLTRILWAGQGSRLCQQASTNPRVKRFLSAVPYVMNSIKDVHQAVIDNNLETLQAKMEPPVPPALITCRDANGLNLIHKAAGLGHTKILEYLIGIWPDGAAETDITGKTPLHWAASHKNNMRCYTLLTQAGCDEEAMDYKMKSPIYYRHKPHEIERAFLVYVPEAPRVSPDIVTDWEALSEDVGEGCKKLGIKIPDTNGTQGRTNDDSIENTSEVDLNDGISATEEEQRSATPITNGNGGNGGNENSATHTPALDENEATEDGDGGVKVIKEIEETEAIVNGNDNSDTEAEVQIVETNDDDEAADDEEEKAEPEVDAPEEETIIKTLNETTTTAANGSEEHAEQGESETNEATNESEYTAESESTIGDGAKVEEKEKEPTELEDTNEVNPENKERELLEEENAEAADKEEDSNGEKKDKVVEVEPRDIDEVKVVNEKETVEKIHSKEKVAEETALAIDPRIGDEGEQVEEKKESVQNDEENQDKKEEDATQDETKKELDNNDSDGMRLDENEEIGLENDSNAIERQKGGIINRVTRAIDDVKNEAVAVGTMVVDKISKGVTKVEEKIEELKTDSQNIDDKENSEEHSEKEGDKENGGLEEESNENNNNEKEKNEGEGIKENNEEIAEDIKKESEEVNKKPNDAGNNNSKLDEGKEKIYGEISTEQNKFGKEPEAPEVEWCIGDTAIIEKTDVSNKNLSNNKNEDIDKRELSAKNKENIKVNDSEKNTTLNDSKPQSAQFDKIPPNDENISNNNGDRKIANPAAPEVNDKTDENENNEKEQQVENANEDTTIKGNTKSEIIEMNGGTSEDKLQTEAEAIEQTSGEILKTINEQAAERIEQNSNKMPRLSTAKVMRGRRNSSAKRNGSAKKKHATLIEGENENAEDDGDEEEDEVQFGML